MKPLILIGYFREIVELCEFAGYKIVGIVDNIDPKSKYPYIGNDDTVLQKAELYNRFPICIVPDKPLVRIALFNRYTQEGFSVESIISPDAFISPTASIGDGCIIQRGCNISTDVILGKCVRVNTMANIMHDSAVGEFSTIAPNAVILGRCKIGNSCYIGANSTILPDLSIYDNVVVGAGAVVTKSINESITVVGVPAKKLNS